MVGVFPSQRWANMTPMVELLDLLVLVLALGAGLWAAVMVVQRAPVGPRGFDRPFLTHILLFNLLILAGLVYRFALQHGFALLPMVLPLAVLTVMAALKLTWLRAFMQTADALCTGGRILLAPRAFRNLAVALFLAYSALAWSAWFLAANSLFQVVLAVFELLVLGGAAAAALKVLLEARGIPAGNRRGALTFFALYHLGLLAMLVPMLMAGWLHRGVLTGSQQLVMSGFLLVFNLFPMIWLHWFAPRKDTPRDGRFEQLGITPRERDVIALMRQGKTNREIAEALFISEATVKDHNNNLFRKCGVRNRVELVTLFQESP